MFQGALGSSSYDAECSPEHFDTLFHQIGPKNEVPLKKLNWMRPSSNAGFWAAPQFLVENGCQNAQDYILHHNMSWSPKEFET